MASTILHVDMDAFFAAIEQRDKPELRGKPVVIGAGRNQRGVVSTASYEARRFGIHSAMPSREAGRRCPGAIFIPPDMARYHKVSVQLFNILDSFTGFVEPVSVDEAFLDVTGVTRLFGDGPCIAEKIRNVIRTELRLTASVGVASNKFLAKIASDMNKPDGVTIVPDDADSIRKFLAPLPVGKLWGVGNITRSQFQKHGIHTIGDIQRMSVESLRPILSDRSIRHFKALAIGEDARVVEAAGEEKSISREHTFDVDAMDDDVIKKTLISLISDVGRRLRASGNSAGVIHIKIRWKNFETITRQKTLSQPICDDSELRNSALAIYNGITIRGPVRLIGMGVVLTKPLEDQQLLLFETPNPEKARQERLSRAVDTIRQKFGKNSIQNH
jgi:DNA polymerase-4